MDVRATVLAGKHIVSAVEPLAEEVASLRGLAPGAAAALDTAERPLIRAFDGPGKATAEELGNKGFWLAEMTRLGMPVPPGFTISTRAADRSGEISKGLWTDIRSGVRALEQKSGQRFGDGENPLVVSVRSGGAVSMPGMMDTVSNVGLNETIVRRMAQTGDPALAWGSYSRFLRSYGSTVLGVPRDKFQAIPQPVDSSLASALERQSDQYRRIIEDAGGKVPERPLEQLHQSVSAVFRSWNNPRAESYRQLQGIPDNLGTAVSVERMVFGNQANSGTGIALSHDFRTGKASFNGEWLPNAQGEALVSGTSTPEMLSRLNEAHPEIYRELRGLTDRIQRHMGKPAEVEFTVEKNRLFLLQARGQRLSPEATITRVVEDVQNGKLEKADALARITPAQIDAVRIPRFDETELSKAQEIAKGIAASPGAAVGRVVHSAQEAVAANARGESVVLVLDATHPDDLDGMLAAKAMVTRVGGATSHAATVALEQGKPSVTSSNDLSKLDGIVSVDGFTGRVYQGAVKTEQSVTTKEVETFLKWVDDAEAQKWPAPRISDEPDYNTRLLAPETSDYYLAKLMAARLRATPLAEEADKLRVSTTVTLAEKMASTVFHSLSYELRSLPEQPFSSLQRDVDVLTKEFGLQFHYSEAWQPHEFVFKRLVDSTPEEKERFLNSANKLFTDAAWSDRDMPIYYRKKHGGENWMTAGKALQRFFNRELSHNLFIDHAMDLTHNNGRFFEDPEVRKVLDVKLHARSLRELYDGLSQFDLHPNIRSLYDKAVKLNSPSVLS